MLVLPGMVSWWKGEDNTQDSVGANHGTPLGGVYYTAGKVNKGFTFDSNDDRVTIPHNANLNFNLPGFTAEFWMKGVHNQPDTYFLLFDKSHGWVDSKGWNFQGESASGSVTFGCGTGGGWTPAIPSADLLDGNWHHLAGTWNGGTLSFYVDGVLLGSAPLTTPDNNTRAVNMAYSWGGGAPQRFFRGMLDELTIYDRALTLAEVQAIYAAGSGGKGGMPPAITQQPQSVTTNTGASVTFSVSANGMASFYYQPRKSSSVADT